MRGKMIWIIGAMMLTCSGKIYAQTEKWAQFSLAGGYAQYSDTYEKPGAFYNVDMEVHFTRRVYGSMLFGYSTYEGQSSVLVDFPNERIPDNVSDKRTGLLFAVGPGLDLLSNHIDRFYLTLYGGYAVVRSERLYYEGTVMQSDDRNRNGAMALARLGYEHQFGNLFVTGVYAQCGSWGKSFVWGAGLRIGLRLTEFGAKKPSRLLK